MPNSTRTIRLEIDSAIEMLDLIHTVTDHIGRTAGLDEDGIYWFGMAVREGVANAITHGNCGDSKKVVSIEFTTTPVTNPSEIAVCIGDQGEGFDPDTVPDPLAGENTLRTSGRGLFMMRQFMDAVSIQRRGGNGMEVRLMKRITKNS
jgi:serine/threonine-protein kinase RsbW